MFTGIIQTLGTIESIRKEKKQTTFAVRPERAWRDSFCLGESIAVDGVCLTVVQFSKRDFRVEAVPETLRLSTLGSLKKGSRVNLERSLRFGDRLGGHLVFGHVDGVGKISKKLKRGRNYFLEIQLPKALASYMTPKGSITVDGMSLTLQRVHGNSFEAAIVPHTAKCTTIGSKKMGELVNLEIDMLAKQVYRYLNSGRNRPKHKKA